MRFTVDFLAIFVNYRNFFICTNITRVLLEIIHGGGGINIRGFSATMLAYRAYRYVILTTCG